MQTFRSFVVYTLFFRILIYFRLRLNYSVRPISINKENVSSSFFLQTKAREKKTKKLDIIFLSLLMLIGLKVIDFQCTNWLTHKDYSFLGDRRFVACIEICLNPIQIRETQNWTQDFGQDSDIYIVRCAFYDTCVLTGCQVDEWVWESKLNTIVWRSIPTPEWIEWNLLLHLVNSSTPWPSESCNYLPLTPSNLEPKYIVPLALLT